VKICLAFAVDEWRKDFAVAFALAVAFDPGQLLSGNFKFLSAINLGPPRSQLSRNCFSNVLTDGAAIFNLTNQ